MIHQRVAYGVRAHDPDMAQSRVRVRGVNSQTLRTTWRSARPHKWGQEGAILILQTRSSPDNLVSARTESQRKGWLGLQERGEGEEPEEKVKASGTGGRTESFQVSILLGWARHSVPLTPNPPWPQGPPCTSGHRPSVQLGEMPQGSKGESLGGRRVRL